MDIEFFGMIMLSEQWQCCTTVAAETFTLPAYDTAANQLPILFLPPDDNCIVQGFSISAELLVRIKYMTLFVSGKRRYDRKQCGYGGQTKPIFHKKVCDVNNVSSAYIILIT